MAYVDTPEFKEKADAFRKASEARRLAHLRSVFDAETEPTEPALDADAFLKKLKEA